MAHLLEPAFQMFSAEVTALTRHTIAVSLALLFITLIHVILGEQVPKLAALQSTERIALWVARPLNLFTRLSLPILKLMNAASNLVLHRLGYRSDGIAGSLHSVKELRMLIEDTEEAGLIETEQAKFLQNVFALTDKKVRECMIPREKMDALEMNTPRLQLLEKVREWGHTRIPVYEGELDRIIGILNTKNLFYMLTLDPAMASVFALVDAVYPATTIDPDDSIGSALRLFKRSRRPMAVVKTKEGQVLGLITLEDILEEIVGDMEDEYDEPNRPTLRITLDVLRRAKKK